jgi:hypothetical protein
MIACDIRKLGFGLPARASDILREKLFKLNQGLVIFAVPTRF